MTSIDIPGYRPGTWVLDPSHSEVTFSAVSYTHLTLPTNREV